MGALEAQEICFRTVASEPVTGPAAEEYCQFRDRLMAEVRLFAVGLLESLADPPVGHWIKRAVKAGLVDNRHKSTVRQQGQ